MCVFYLFIYLFLCFSVSPLIVYSDQIHSIKSIWGCFSMQMEYLVGLSALCCCCFHSDLCRYANSPSSPPPFAFHPFILCVCHTRHLTNTIQIDCRISIRFFSSVAPQNPRTWNCLHDRCIHPFSHCVQCLCKWRQSRKQFGSDGINKFNVHRYFGCTKMIHLIT